MAVNSIYTTWGWAYGGDNGYSQSLYLSFAPQSYAIAQTALATADGNGLCSSGISEYTIRPNPNGADQKIDFNWSTNFGYPPGVWNSNMTSVTSQLEVGGNGQQGTYNLTIFFLS